MWEQVWLINHCSVPLDFLYFFVCSTQHRASRVCNKHGMKRMLAFLQSIYIFQNVIHCEKPFYYQDSNSQNEIHTHDHEPFKKIYKMHRHQTRLDCCLFFSLCTHEYFYMWVHPEAEKRSCCKKEWNMTRQERITIKKKMRKMHAWHINCCITLESSCNKKAPRSSKKKNIYTIFLSFVFQGIPSWLLFFHLSNMERRK